MKIHESFTRFVDFLLVEITVDKDQPSRQPVAFRLKDPATELAAPKFQGTKFWPAKIMLVGDLVK